MMYWPLSVVKDHPLMPPAYAYELHRVYNCGLSDATMNAVYIVAERIPPVHTDAVVIQTDGQPLKLEYMALPSREDWERLERAGFYSTGPGGVFFLHVAALH